MTIPSSDFEISLLREKIAVESAIRDWELDYGLYALGYPNHNGLITEEAAKSSVVSGFKNFVSKIVKAVKRTMHDLIVSISNIFKRKASTKEIMDSDGMKDMFQSNVNQVKAVVDGEMREGCKLLQMASSKTGLPDTLIEPYLTKGAQKVESLANAKNLEKLTTKSVFGTLNILAKFTSDKMDEAESAASRVTDPSTTHKCERIFKHLWKCAGLVNKTGSSLFKKGS